MLGVFLPLQSGGASLSTLARTTSWTFDYNLAVTRRAEQFGFDLAFGAGEWLSKDGFGGETSFHGVSLDPFVTANALVALTQRIIVVSTVHILYGLHPLMLAKFGATMDHISGGRWGINVVTGHRAREHRRFGHEQIDHDVRYAMADEFVAMAQALWSADDDLTWNGAYWRMEDAHVAPKPLYGRPVVVTATGSPAGIEFAGKHADMVFTSSVSGAGIEDALATLGDHTARIRDAAARRGRSVKVLINPMIVCADSDAEAHERRDAIVNAADAAAIPGFGAERSDAQGYRGHASADRLLGGNIQLVGGPATIARHLRGLTQAGIDGVQISFFDFLPDLEHFALNVMPLLREAGLRRDDA